MKTGNTINLIAKSLSAIVLLSQLAACNFMATASGAVGDSQRTAGADVYETEASVTEVPEIIDAEMVVEAEMVIDDTGSVINEVSRSAINKILSWTAPVTREDASAISMAEIAGFRVYYGTAQGEYKQYVEINDAYTDEVKLSTFKLKSDTYYMVITTIDTSGRESAFSEEVIIEA